jgi:hypothetical protein
MFKISKIKKNNKKKSIRNRAHIKIGGTTLPWDEYFKEFYVSYGIKKYKHTGDSTFFVFEEKASTKHKLAPQSHDKQHIHIYNNEAGFPHGKVNKLMEPNDDNLLHNIERMCKWVIEADQGPDVNWKDFSFAVLKKLLCEYTKKSDLDYFTLDDFNKFFFIINEIPKIMEHSMDSANQQILEEANQELNKLQTNARRATKSQTQKEFRDNIQKKQLEISQLEESASKLKKDKIEDYLKEQITTLFNTTQSHFKSKLDTIHTNIKLYSDYKINLQKELLKEHDYRYPEKSTDPELSITNFPDIEKVNKNLFIHTNKFRSSLIYRLKENKKLVLPSIENRTQTIHFFECLSQGVNCLPKWKKVISKNGIASNKEILQKAVEICTYPKFKDYPFIHNIKYNDDISPYYLMSDDKYYLCKSYLTGAYRHDNEMFLLKEFMEKKINNMISEKVEREKKILEYKLHIFYLLICNQPNLRKCNDIILNVNRKEFDQRMDVLYDLCTDVYKELEAATGTN